MSCPQDIHYTTPVTPDPVRGENSTCGSCAVQYDQCYNGSNSYSNPSCCPDGYSHVGETSCGSCWYAGAVVGRKFTCVPNQPNMTEQSKVNCCSNTNLPNHKPEGYCASGWCPSSVACSSFMTSYCKDKKLSTPECGQFCRNNPGKCDDALKQFCSKSENITDPVCGCALPDKYYILKTEGITTPGGVDVPISCDRRCGTNKDAVRLLGQQDCKINAICVVNLRDVKFVEGQLNPNIEIRQNCGNSSTEWSFTQWIQTTHGKVISLIAIIIIILIIAIIIYLIVRK